VVHASRAVRERPESLTARSLYERARRELLRGRRRERLEARVKEAVDLYEAGDFAASSRIVTTALKLVPDHALALQLFGRLRDRRLQAPTAEAEAERELDRLSRGEAERTLEQARAALAARWDSRALLSIRRGLRHMPDHPQLLALHREVQAALEADHVRHVGRRVRQAQVRHGLDLLRRGQFEESLTVLRGLLREDPDYAPAQAAIQEVRRAWLGRPAAAAHGPAPVAASPSLLAAPAPSPAREVSLAGTWHAPSPRPAAAPRPSQPAGAAIPPEILLPRTRRSTTPWPWIAFGAGSLVVGLLLLRGQGEREPRARPSPLASPSAAAAAAAAAPAVTAPPEEATGPLTLAPPELRQVIVSTLAAYGRALEGVDPAALAAARPDLGPAEREALLAPLKGAVNVATDLRVLDVTLAGDTATVPVLRTDIVIGGRGTGPPVEETLSFTRRDGAWSLRASR
jgi:tetratricopeptide (TPR) repeat protein